MSEINVDGSDKSEKSLEELSLALHRYNVAGALKKRVRSVDPNEGRCLIENVPEHCIVDYIHCYPKRKAGRKSLIASLEWHWNVSRGDLELSTRYNVFPVRPHLHYLYEHPKPSGSWMLLPSDDVVQQYHDALRKVDDTWTSSRESFPSIENGEFTYRFAPFGFERSMTDLFITRQDKQREPDTAMSASNFSVHSYPFSSLPLVRSHLHPRFVILEASRKLGALNSDQVANLILDYPILTQIAHIGEAWTQPCPDPDFVNELSEDEGNPTPVEDHRDTKRAPRPAVNE